MNVRLKDRRKRSKRSGQVWRHLRVAMRLVLRRPIVSVAVVPVLADGRIVLARRVDSDLWVVPGGIMDWGETVEESARRELNEETGLEISRLRRLVGVYSSPSRDTRTHSISIGLAADVTGEPSIDDPLEISEITSFEPEDIPFQHLSFGMESLLRDFLEGRTVIS